MINKSMILPLLDTSMPHRQMSDIELIQNSAEFMGCYTRFKKSNIQYFDDFGDIISPICKSVSFFNKITREECTSKDISCIIVVITLAVLIHISELETSIICLGKCTECNTSTFTMKKCCNIILF